MSRIKTKRILWTIAVLLALSFLGAMVLHKHEEPQIIGKISPEDISAISKITLKFRRDQVKERMGRALQDMDILQLIMETADFARLRVLSIKAESGDQFEVSVGTGTNGITLKYFVIKEGSGWKVSPNFFEM